MHGWLIPSSVFNACFCFGLCFQHIHSFTCAHEGFAIFVQESLCGFMFSHLQLNCRFVNIYVNCQGVVKEVYGLDIYSDSCLLISFFGEIKSFWNERLFSGDGTFYVNREICCTFFLHLVTGSVTSVGLASIRDHTQYIYTVYTYICICWLRICPHCICSYLVEFKDLSIMSDFMDGWWWLVSFVSV